MKITCTTTGTPEEMLRAFKNRIAELSGTVESSEYIGNDTDDMYEDVDVMTYDTVQASDDIDDEDYYYYNDSDMWEEISHRQVKDSDGFMTDYTLYHYIGDPDDVDGEVYICMFGDNELYTPDLGYADWSGETLEEAEDWFYNYESYQDVDL